MRLPRSKNRSAKAAAAIVWSLFIASCGTRQPAANEATEPLISESSIYFPSPTAVSEHRNVDQIFLRVPDFKFGFVDDVFYYDVTVDRFGNVTSVKARPSGDKLLSTDHTKADALVKSQRYKPFERNGIAVDARFSEPVELIPQEKLPATHKDIPVVRDWFSLRMGLSRHNCSGPCSVYQVEVSGDGTVSYEGFLYVAVRGKHVYHISREKVRTLFDVFQAANFFDLDDQYELLYPESADVFTRLIFDDHKKTVDDDRGIYVGMPQSAMDIESRFDEIVGTDRWVKGNSETVPSLVAEEWDFKAKDVNHSSMLAEIAQRGTSGAVLDLIAAGAQLDSTIPEDEGIFANGPSALTNAAARADDKVLRVVLSKMRPGKSELNQALISAASLGRASNIAILLDAGADVNTFDRTAYEHHRTPLMAVIEIGNPDAVDILLKRHADVGARDEDGKTALMYLNSYGRSELSDYENSSGCKIAMLLLSAGADRNARDNDGNNVLMQGAIGASLVPLLVKAGVDINAQNNEGKTALMNSGVSVIPVLLENGADPWIVDKNGKNASDELASNKEDYARKEEALLRDWMKSHPESGPRH